MARYSYGLWASSLDFDAPGSPPGIGADAEVEIDYYAGFKPTWGRFNFDFGVIYYSYPGASDFAAELDGFKVDGGYASYDSVSPAQRQQIADKAKALAAALDAIDPALGLSGL